MKYSAALVLGAAATQAAAGHISHRHAPGKVHNHAVRHAEILKEQDINKRGILSDAAGFLKGLGAQVGVNAVAPTSNVWIGSDGPYKNEITNAAAEDVIVTCWGPAGSWINAVQPLITHKLGPGENVTLSYAEGASGACAPVHGDTTMVNGQVFNTWLEYTFAGIYSTYDVSREVNMKGRPISVQGPNCLSDMDTCVFKCKDESAPSCWFDYALFNCDAGNGGGSGKDPTTGDAAGGCNGLTGGSGTLYTTFS